VYNGLAPFHIVSGKHVPVRLYLFTYLLKRVVIWVRKDSLNRTGNSACAEIALHASYVMQIWLVLNAILDRLRSQDTMIRVCWCMQVSRKLIRLVLRRFPLVVALHDHSAPSLEMHRFHNCRTRSIWKMLGPFATRAAAHPISRCRYRYCRAPPAHQCPRRQRQRVTEEIMEWAQ